MPESRQEEMFIAVNVLGLGQRPAAWQSPRLHALSFVDIDYWEEVAQVAERGALDALFLADSPSLDRDPRLRPSGGLEPTVLLAALAERTENIGFIATASTTFNDPFEFARRLLTVDELSGGRIGWNIVTTRAQASAQNFGLSDVLDREERYRRAAEFVAIVEGLWRSAADGRRVSHTGEFFDVSGQLEVPPSAQGGPALIQAGGSPGGRTLAGSKANGVFTAEMTHSAALEHYSLLKRYAVEAGRPSEAVRVLPGFALVVASTEKEAIERYDELESKGPENYTEYRLSGILGVDVTTLELDEPLPEWITPVPEDPAAFSGSLAFREATVTFAREGRLTVRQLLRSYGGYGHPIIIGTPEQVVDTLVDWFESRAADGFNLMPDVFPDGLETLVDHVLPILRKRGYFSSDYERKRTLRERLSPARIVR